MQFQPSQIHGTIGSETTRSVSKLVFGAVSLIVILALTSLLPGIDRVIPGTPVSLFAVVWAIASIVLALVLLSIASGLAGFAHLLLDGPRELVENLASIVHWLAVLAAVLIAHRGLSSIVSAILGDAAWAFDVIFLLLAIPPLVIIAVRLYVSLDPAVDVVDEKLAGQ